MTAILKVLIVIFLQSDPDKQSNMPTDGTVHELTSNVSTVTFKYLK